MLGCAILAAVAAGLHPHVLAAAAAMVRVTRTVHPAPGAEEAYRGALARYAALYPALRPLFHGRGGHGGEGGGGGGGQANGDKAEVQAVAGGSREGL